MSAAAQNRIFGVRLGVDPKLIVVGLVVVAGVLYWFNSRNSDETGPAVTTPRAASAPAVTPRLRPVPTRRQARNDSGRATLRLQAVDATRGDIDPTLRLDLLARLQTVNPAADDRNLFEMGAAPAPAADISKLNQKIIPTSKPGPITPVTVNPADIPLNIPLKFYGFVRPFDKNASNQGFFLDGDNVLIASEGEVLKGRYLVVELTPNSARLEDTQLKKSQTLPVVPEAHEEM